MSLELKQHLFDLGNALVWVAFVYLGYRAVLIVSESFRRRGDLRRLASEVRAIRMQIVNLVTGSETANGSTREECRTRFMERARRVWSQSSEPALRELLPNLCQAIVAGRQDQAMDLVDRFLVERQSRPAAEQSFKDRCLQNGCLGTVLGLWQAFAVTPNRQEIPLSTFGFALSTTALGLVLGAAIDMCLTVVFESAWRDLHDELEETRHQWQQLWFSRIEMLSDVSEEVSQLDQLNGEFRTLRESLTGASVAMSDVFAQLPGQIAVEFTKGISLAAAVESPHDDQLGSEFRALHESIRELSVVMSDAIAPLAGQIAVGIAKEIALSAAVVESLPDKRKVSPASQPASDEYSQSLAAVAVGADVWDWITRC